MNATVDLTKLSQAQLIDLINKQREATKAKLSFKVSEKGACSVFGLQRFPVTLYKGQWEALLENQDKLVAFLNDPNNKFSVKD